MKEYKNEALKSERLINFILKSSTVLVFLLLFSIKAAYSQACDPLTDPFCDDTDVPLDGGVCFLIGAGVVCAYKKLSNKNTESL